MRQIIDGLLYCTFDATKIFKVDLGSKTWVDVYQTKGGRYFKMRGWWGCAGSQTIEAISEHEAIELVARSGDVELYQKMTGNIVKSA